MTPTGSAQDWGDPHGLQRCVAPDPVRLTASPQQRGFPSHRQHERQLLEVLRQHWPQESRHLPLGGQ